MILIVHKPLKQKSGDFNNSYHIVGENVDELIEKTLEKIRPQSKEFYKNYLREMLLKYGRCLVDIHAGMGYYYTAVLIEAP